MDRPHRTRAAGGFMVEFRKAVAEDLRLLAHLHDAEPDACRLEQLRAQAFQDCLGLKLMSPIGQEGLEIFDAALRALPQPISSDLVELRNLILVADLMIQCAIRRKESRGLHYTLDYPDLKDRTEDTVLTPPSFG